MSSPQSNEAHFTRAQIENTLANLEEDLKRWDHEHDLRWRCAEAEAQSEQSWSKCSEATRRWSAAFLKCLDAPQSQIAALDLREATKDCEETRAAYLLATNACRALRQEWTTHMDESAANHKADLLARLEYVRSLTPLDTPSSFGFTHSCNNCGFMTYTSHAGETCEVSGCYGVYEEGVGTESKSRWSQEEIDLAQMLYRSGRPSVPRWRDVIDEVKEEYLVKARAQIESEKSNG